MEIASIKGIFLRYLLMPLFTGIMIFVMGAIRKSRPAIKIRTIILYVLITSLGIAIPGFLGFSGNLFNPYWYLLAMIYYLGLGILHVNMLHRHFRKHFEKLWKASLFDAVMSITVLVAGGYLFTIIFRWISKGMGNEYMAATSSIIFLVPLVFYYCYIQFISIPFNIYKTWQYDPAQKPPDFRGADFDRLMVLNVELSKNAEDQQRFNIKAKTLPIGISFGDWFLRVIDDYNFKHSHSPIRMVDESGQAYYWIFYVKKSFFSLRKYIDFEKDITENNITQNETVVCKRVLHHQEEGR